ncbi:MAG: hypothetical protein QNK20_14185 [Aureibaculum sp.]|nr:hypothetical protein [Aureibaculum sp.]
MTKIEELTELLVNEINDFNKGITKLEKINDQISTTKIRLDVTEYKSIIENHEQKMNDQIRSQELFESWFKSLLKTAKVYPNWAVIVFLITFIFAVVSTTFIIISKQDAYSLGKEAYQKGVIDSNNNIQVFFEKHPISEKAFEIWKEKADIEN